MAEVADKTLTALRDYVRNVLDGVKRKNLSVDEAKAHLEEIDRVVSALAVNAGADVKVPQPGSTPVRSSNAPGARPSAEAEDLQARIAKAKIEGEAAPAHMEPAAIARAHQEEAERLRREKQ